MKALKSFVFFWDSYSFKVNYKLASSFGFNLILQIHMELVLWTLEEMVRDSSQLYKMQKSLVSNTGSITEANGT